MNKKQLPSQKKHFDVRTQHKDLGIEYWSEQFNPRRKTILRFILDVLLASDYYAYQKLCSQTDPDIIKDAIALMKVDYVYVYCHYQQLVL